MRASSLGEEVEVAGYRNGGEVREDRNAAMLMPQRIEQPMLIVREKA
jgi:hypothetical protein